MALIIAFLVFVVSMISCLVLGQSILIALVIGLFAFVVVGCTKGFSPGKVFTMAWHGVRDSLVVLEIMFMIGFITAIWRASGTITFFVYYGCCHVGDLLWRPLFSGFIQCDPGS